MASVLVNQLGSKMVAITDGGNGSIIATPSNVSVPYQMSNCIVCSFKWVLMLCPASLKVVVVEAPQVSKVIDTTGAGDAFLGGLIVGEPICYTRHIYSGYLLYGTLLMI